MERKKLLKKEVMGLFNITSETLRHYEKKGLIMPEIGENGYRYYGFEEIQKLRQILFFKDLNLPLAKLTKLQKGEIAKEAYKGIILKQKEYLNNKIRELQKVEEEVDYLIDLLANSEDRMFFFEKAKRKRRYLTIDIDTKEMVSPKSYYEYNKKLIKEEFYSEKQLNLIYNYNQLEQGSFFQVELAVEVGNLQLPHYNIRVFNEAKYLSVFYLFKRGDFEGLKEVKLEIDRYLLENRLKRVNELVLEKEHPGLSIFLEEGLEVMELEVEVTRV